MSFKLKKYRLLTLFERALIHLLNARLNALFSSNPSNIKILHTLFFIVIFIFAGLTGWGQTVTTDKLDYAPGETVKITGSGFFPGEIILLEIEHIEPNLPVPFHTHTPWETVADSIGNFNSTWYVDTPELNTTLLLTASGQTSEETATVIFKDATNISISITSGSNPTCLGSLVIFTATATGGSCTKTYQWNKNGAAIPNETSSTYTSNSLLDGDVITCTQTSKGGGCSVVTSAGITMTVNPNVTPTFTQVAAICSGESLSPLTTTSNNGITGIWSPALNNTATTTYTFTPNAGQCATTTTMTITVNPLPTANITGTSAICSGANTVLSSNATAGSGSIASYQWNLEGAAISGATSATYSASAAGNYTVTVTNSNGCTYTSPSFTLTVNALPTAIISSNNSPVCTGDDAVFTLTGTSGATVTYNVNSGADQTVILSGGTATVTVSGATANQILNLVSVTDGTCSQSLSGNSTVSVYQKPTITLSASNAEVCFGDILASIPYSAKSESPDQYSIDFDAVAEGQGFADILNSTLSGGAIDFAVPAAGVPDSYNAVLTVRNSVTGCVSIPLNISVVIHPLPDTSEIQTN